MSFRVSNDSDTVAEDIYVSFDGQWTGHQGDDPTGYTSEEHMLRPQIAIPDLRPGGYVDMTTTGCAETSPPTDSTDATFSLGYPSLVWRWV